MRIATALGVPIGLLVAQGNNRRLRSVHQQVFGLTPPPLTPMILSSHRWRNGDLVRAALSYGQILEVNAPLIEVMTRIGVPTYLPSLESEVLHRERRDAAIGRGDWQEMAGDVEEIDKAKIESGAASYEDRDIIAQGGQLTVSVIVYKHYQAFHFRYKDFSVRVVSRHYTIPEFLAFGLVEDLQPYLQGHIRFLTSLIWSRPSRSAHV